MHETDCASVRQESIWLGNSIQGNSVLKNDWIEVGRVTIFLPMASVQGEGQNFLGALLKKFVALPPFPLPPAK